MKSVPEVSVVITNYNYAEYLPQAVQSVLDQTYKNINLIIFDDASTDDSVEILKEYGHQAKIVKHKKNKGIVYTRNEALDMVSTPYILFLDADDWLDTGYVETLVADAQKKSLDIVYCDAQYFISDKGDMKQSLSPPIFNLERLKNGNFIHMSSLMSTKAIGDTRFDKSMEKITHEDWDFFLNLSLQGLAIGKSDDAELNYRVKPFNRNMHLDDEIGFANLYQHIYEKYKVKYAAEFEYLAYYRFALGLKRVGGDLILAQDEVNKYRLQSDNYSRQLSDLRVSKSYRICRLIMLPARLLKKILKKTLQIFSTLYFNFTQTAMHKNAVVNIFNFKNKRHNNENYFIHKDGSFERKSKHAVVVHLYHQDRWETAFRDKLLSLREDLSFDLYVTLPGKNLDSIPVVRESIADANFLVVPNKGRDVLPFIKTAALLSEMKYEKVLKLHSKKSQHRDRKNNRAESGDDWLTNSLDALIPDDKDLRSKLISTLNKKTTGIVGAVQYYYPLKMYLKNNMKWMNLLFQKVNIDILAKWDTAQLLKRFGYFGGTMFWVDLKSINSLLDISQNNFQKEKGQYDGTIAHSLERMFSILPQINKKNVYGITDRAVVKLGSKDTQYPDWYYDDISGGKPSISIIVPVYSDWSSLSKNISSLKKLLQNSEDISVHYVNDCGPDADDLEIKIKDQIKGVTNFYYYRNKQNLGFVKTCNKAAFELVDKRDDILLLNSDTKVTDNFVKEMRAVLYSETKIGAVTSRSNNATIWSVPMTSKLAHHRLSSYTFYRLIKYKLPEKYITPTIHGFCVLIRRKVLDDHGLFDEIYGKGYGEENDFAMRIREQGWQCAVANYSYVFHYESRSFGNEARDRQIEENEKILTARYPNYRKLVQEYWDSVKEPMK